MRATCGTGYRNNSFSTSVVTTKLITGHLSNEKSRERLHLKVERLATSVFDATRQTDVRIYFSYRLLCFYYLARIAAIHNRKHAWSSLLSQRFPTAFTIMFLTRAFIAYKHTISYYLSPSFSLTLFLFFSLLNVFILCFCVFELRDPPSRTLVLSRFVPPVFVPTLRKNLG